MRMKIFLGLLCAFMGLGLAAQDGGATQSSGEAPRASDDYILQPLDLLQIRVFQEPEMDREVRMSREAAVMLPLIGRVNLAGMTIRQAEELVQELYDRDYLVNPQINLTVLEYARRTVNVLGSVGSPGEIEFPREEGLSLLDAISRAGGFTRLADRRKVRLTRQTGSDGSENFIVNADDMIEGDSTEQWYLQTGDLIFVPERLL
jgi:polysaccharide biosynthesis/export protein